MIALVVLGGLILTVLVAMALGFIRVELRRPTDDDPPKSGIGRPCSWCRGHIDPPNHQPSCPIKGAGSQK